MEIQIPYGCSYITAILPDHIPIDIIEPQSVPAASDPKKVVRDSLDSLLGDVEWSTFLNTKSVGIAINDKTRPVPHEHLLPPLMDRLESMGIPDDAITFYIAVGTHPPMFDEELDMILPEFIQERYRIISHDSEDERLLVNIGTTKLGTPIWTNAAYYHSDFKIVLGNIEPHQFMGFSGGVKTAAVGLAGLKMINTHHALMTHPDSKLGEYETNPARQDIEEVGKMMEIHLALNAILNQEREIVYALAGGPRAVMEIGIPLSRKICQVAVHHKYDLMIASAGGHPKDIDVYQSQKGISHAARIVQIGSTIILAAACPEGTGNPHYEDWMVGKTSYDQVLDQFQAEGFRIGPHKAYLIARDAARINLRFYSEMPNKKASDLLLNPVDDFQATIELALTNLQPNQRVGILPHASSTIPYIKE